MNIAIKIVRTFFLIPLIFISLINKSITRVFKDLKEVTGSHLNETIMPFKTLFRDLVHKVGTSAL